MPLSCVCAASSTTQVEALHEEIQRLDHVARELSAYGDAADAQLNDVKRLLVSTSCHAWWDKSSPS